MGESIQKRLGRVRPPRVQITYDVEVGDAIVKKELPFVMGIMADLAGDRTVREDLGLPPVPEYKLRTFAAVDRDNFDDIMKTVAPALKLSGLDRFITEDASAAWREGGVEPEKAAFSCALRFEKLDDFRPECLVKNVETLAAFFERRNLLQDLAAKLDGNDALQASLQKMLFPTGDSVSELDALRKAYKEALASVDAARDAVSKAGEDQEKQKAAEEGVQQAETAASEAKKKLDEKRKAKRPDTEAIAAAMVRNSGDPDEDKRQREVADARLAACLAEHEDNPFTLPASGSMLGMLTERVACKDKLLACQLDAILHAEAFQELEAVWRGLHYLVFNTETSDRLKLRLFNASFKELRTDLERAVEFDQSLLFKRVYEEEYGLQLPAPCPRIRPVGGGPRRAPEDGGSSRRSAHPPAQCRVAAAFRAGELHRSALATRSAQDFPECGLYRMAFVPREGRFPLCDPLPSASADAPALWQRHRSRGNLRL